MIYGIPRTPITRLREFFGSRALCSPAHEFLCSRKLRLAPQDYSPWTPRSDRLSGRSYPPASRHCLEQPSRSTRWTCRQSFTRESRDLVGSAFDEHGGDGKSPGHVLLPRMRP